MKHLCSVSLLLIFVLFAGCRQNNVCTLLACAFPQGASLTFKGYELPEIDTLYLTGYETGSNFTKVVKERHIDQVTDYSNGSHEASDTDTSLRYYYVDASIDWELQVPATNQSFRFNNFKFTMLECNKCRYGKDLQPSLSSFSVNGEEVNSAKYTINR